jgi:arsenical pump membrane protein
MTQAFAFLILAMTVTVSIARPRLGMWRLGHVEAAVVGAFLTLATGVVSPGQALKALGTLSVPIVTIASLMAITLIAEKAGLLQHLAYTMTKRARGNPRRLFTYIFVVGTTMGTFFTNDAAILILTPLVFAIVESAKMDGWTQNNKFPFYFSVLYVGNLVGALVISNPINIVLASIFDIGFFEYAAWMFVPAIASFLVSYAGLLFYFRNWLPLECKEQPEFDVPTLDRAMIWPCGIILTVTILGFFSEGVTGIPVWLVAASGATFLLLAHWRSGHAVQPIFRGIGWDVIIFVIGIFIVVIGMRNEGFAHHIGDLISAIGGGTLTGMTFATGFVAAICSAIFNNHPTAGLMIWVVQDISRTALETKILVFSALIGGDLGPKMLPIGSLAALMWFRMLRDRGVQVPYALYIKIGIPVTLTAVAASLLILHLEWLVFATVVG